jgi:RNA binding exosome subunit
MAYSREAERRKVEANYVEITAFCHATEECPRVEHAIRNLLPPDLRHVAKTYSSTHEGYYGNPINILTIKLINKDHVTLLLRHLSSALDPMEKSILKATFNLRYDSSTGRFIIRLSKQDLYLGSLRIIDTDDIVKLTIHFKSVKRRDEVFNYLKAIGLIS